MYSKNVKSAPYRPNLSGDTRRQRPTSTYATQIQLRAVKAVETAPESAAQVKRWKSPPSGVVQPVS